MPDVDERRVLALMGLLQDFVSASRTEPDAVVREAAERLEIALMTQHPPAALRHLLSSARDLLEHELSTRGEGRTVEQVLSDLGRALADED